MSGADTLTHTASSGNINLAVSSDKGVTVSVGGSTISTTSTSGVDVTGTLSSSAALSTQSTLAVQTTSTFTGQSTFKDNIVLEKAATTITHTAASPASLVISSTNGYVQVETVQFSAANIGVSGATNLVALASGGVTVTGTLVSGAATLASASVTGALSAGATTINGATGITGATTITGATVMKGDVTVKKSDGSATVLTVAGASGNTVVHGLLSVAGAHADTSKKLYVNGDVHATGSITAASSSQGATTITGATSAQGDFTVKASDGSEKFKITAASGNTVVQGLLSVAGAHADTSKKLYVNGDIYATGSTTSASDERFKRDVRALDETLDALREEDVRPVTFNFDAEAHPTKVFPEGPQIGFIAQELERVLPNLVHTGADGFKSVAYDRVSVYALAGVKELAAAVRALSETAREQREAIDALRRELDARR